MSKIAEFHFIHCICLKASSLLDIRSIWMTDIFNSQVYRWKLVLCKYVESVNKLSIYISIFNHEHVKVI